MAKKIEVMITAFRDGFQSAYGARVPYTGFYAGGCGSSRCGHPPL